MANNDYITTDCKLTVSKNTAKLDEEIFLYKNDRNIKLLIEIVDNKYRYKSDDLSNLLVKYKASYAQVKWYKNAEVKKEFPIQATDDGKVVFVIEGQLIDEDTELGDYDLQLRLLNESQESIRSLPIIKGAVHILKPLFEEGDIATVNSAVADVSMLSLDGDAIDTYNSDGTYNQTNWGSGDIISSSKLNKLEKVAKDNADKVNKMPAKSIVEGGKIYLAKEDGTKLDSGTELPAGGTGTSYDDTEIKTDINTIKTDLGTEELTTTAKNVKGAVNEVAAQYKDIVNKIENGNIGNNIEPQLMDMPRIYFSEGTLPTSKTATVMKFDYYSKTNEYHGYVDIKCQGTSSMAYPKKNFTIKPYQDKAKTKKLKIDFKGWGKQNKFVLKANWIDITHARNVVSTRLWGDIIKTRADYATALPELLRTSPNQGAIDGFPVLVYSNGVYQGRYTLNIPKDKWMSNMDDALDTHCILCGENYVSGCFRALPVINGNDWTDELHDVVPANIKTSWSNAINFVMTSSDDDFKTNLSNYFDVNSLIDYYLYGLVATHLDGFGKNQLFFCYDGIHWIASVYDMDSTWGLYWNGSKILPTDYRRNQYEDYVNNTSNLLYNRLEQLFMAQLKTRYAELRKDVLSASHIIQKFEEFNDVCPKDIVQEDYASTTGGGKFTGIPSTTTNNIQQLRTNIVGRLTYVDGYINALQEATPCTAITLNNTSLSFTTDAAQTLTATLTPTDTTDTVVWSVLPTGFVTVEDGVVTPIKNGTCVITATCGSQKATCNVTVNLPVAAVTALNLDKDSITLGDNNSKFEDTLTATLTPTNATNKNVTWTASNENVTLVANGLECTVKAKAVGNSIVTCTSQDTTNGTIKDTCNVTVNGIVGSNKLTDFTWSKPSWSNWANQTNYYSFETTITDYVIQNNIDLSTIRIGELTKVTSVNNFQKTPQEGYIISYWNSNIYLSVGISSNKLSDDSVESFTNYCANNLPMTYDKLVPTVLATPSNYATNISNYTGVGGNLSVANGTVTYEGTHSKNSTYYIKGSSTNTGNLNIRVPSSKLVIMDFEYNLISSTDTTDITIGFIANGIYAEGQAHISKIGTGTGRALFMNVTDEETILKDVYVWPGALNSTQSFTIELGDIKYGHIK